MLTFCRLGTEESLSTAEVRRLINQGKISSAMLLRRSDGDQWHQAAEFAELRSAFRRLPKAPRTDGPVLPSLVPSWKTVVSLIGFLVLAFVWGSQCFRYTESNMWPTTDAIVTEKHLTSRGVSIWYHFSVNGQEYIGSSGSLASVGEHLRVRYDPSNPDNSVLDKSAAWNTGVSAIGVIFLAAYAVYYFARTGGARADGRDG